MSLIDLVLRRIKGDRLTNDEIDDNFVNLRDGVYAANADYAGATEPEETWSFMRWADTANDYLKVRNFTNDDWIIVDYLTMSLENRRWANFPIGHREPVSDELTGVAVPPTDNQHFRYIKLTASDSYNSGVLTSESVSGSAPLVVATAVIDLAGSPLDGKTVNLWNTERRSPRAGSAGTLQDDALQNITGTLIHGVQTASIQGATGVFTNAGTTEFRAAQGGTTAEKFGQTITFDSSRVARTSTETRYRNQGVTYYMRIL